MLLFLYLFLGVSSKYLSTTVKLTPDFPWQYVSKFAMVIGTGTFEIKAQLVSALNKQSSDKIMFSSSVYIDKLWPEALSLTSCPDKESTASDLQYLHVPINGDWSNTVQGSLTQNVKTRFWYLTLSKCALSESHKLRIDVKFLNSDGSEFSAEDLGMNYVYLVILLIYFFFLFKNMLDLMQKFEKSEEIQANIVVLVSAIFSQFAGVFFELVHLWIYAYTGTGIMAFDLLHQAFEVVSGIIVTVLFILIANGWTLKYRNFPDADIYIPITMIVIAINLIIVGIGRVSDDSYDKYSEYQGVSVFFLVVFRVGAWAWFVFLVWDMDRNAGVKLMNFLFKFLIAGSAYFLAMPGVVMLSWVFEPYVRKKVIALLLNLIQVLVFTFVMHLFGGKSDYYKLSTMSESVLPGKSQ